MNPSLMRCLEGSPDLLAVPSGLLKSRVCVVTWALESTALHPESRGRSSSPSRVALESGTTALGDHWGSDWAAPKGMDVREMACVEHKAPRLQTHLLGDPSGL